MSAPLYYILNQYRQPEGCYCHQTYRAWLNSVPQDDRTGVGCVLQRDQDEHHVVSTVFMSIDHGFASPVPICFETMVFKVGSSSDIDCQRYATYEEALRGHAEMLAKYMEVPA